jgi:hypothetical protein
MSERYWITGVQLAMLSFNGDLKQKSLCKFIERRQFVGNDYTGKKKIIFDRL